MKYSQFNSLLPFEEGRFALYNSFENKVIFLEKHLKELVENKIKNIDKLQKIHPDFYNYLAENKFIVENDIDEVEKVKEISKNVDNNFSTFLLTVNPTMNCNFKCWYCYETQIKNSQMENSVLDSVKKFITKTVQNTEITYFNVSFFGGEPLLYFKKTVIPVITHLVDECRENNTEFGVSFTTNGYLINDELINYFKSKNINPHFQITFDGYKDEHDKVRFVNSTKGSYDEIVKNIKKLLENRFGIRVRINFTDKNINECARIADDFADVSQETKDKLLMFDFHRVWQNDSLDDISIALKENAKKMQAKGFKTNVQYSPNNVLDSCYADKQNSAVINYNGDIYKCTARDFLPKNCAGYLSKDGDLIWENDHLEKRMNAKFHNKPCLSCRILPLCNGGCSQHAIEHLEKGDEYCVYFSDEREINKVVQTKIEEIINVQFQEV
ncbi:MAG: radical SAM protein [Flavobacteriaceae bacterium]|jgi:uncharacterized protein|nr:radical SAM protein [Flavobacteriaceae bacterium]